jgi:hypothetical protein
VEEPNTRIFEPRRPGRRLPGTKISSNAGLVICSHRGFEAPMNRGMPVPSTPQPRYPGVREPTPTGTVVLLTPLPVTVDWEGRPYRLQIEQESVSGESRLLGVDVTAERAGSYSAFLVALPGRRPALEAKIRGDGIQAGGGLVTGSHAGSKRVGQGRCDGLTRSWKRAASIGARQNFSSPPSSIRIRTNLHLFK